MRDIYETSAIRNEDGFKFIGIDKDGGEHYCIVRKGDDGMFYMNSNTITFQELIGWVHDRPSPNVQIEGQPAFGLSRSNAGLGSAKGEKNEI